MGLSATAAICFLPLVLPICLFVAWNDMRAMKIPNLANGALLLVFILIGPFALPFDEYLWRYLHLIVVLVLGILLNAGGIIGAGDAKFAAAAAPFIAPQDISLVLLILSACFFAGFITHRLAMHSPLRSLVPHWESWSSGRKFPMGLPLGAALVFYLVLGLSNG